MTHNAVGRSIINYAETLLMTYKAVGRTINNYAAPVWCIDHLHTEAEMLKVREHSELLSASTWPDVWNQEMYVIPSQQGPSLKDR